MKKKYTINDEGDVVAVSNLFPCSLYVEADTKAEASRKLLLRAKRSLSFLPEVYLSNGAYALIYPHKETDGFTVDTGPLNRVHSTGQVYSVCSAFASDISKARKMAQENYYSTAEYQNNK